MYVPGPSGPGGYKDAPVFGYSWTGIYGGIQGGGVWGTEDLHSTGNPTDHINMNGGVFGGQLGYQHQFYNNIVAGIEVSGVGAWANGSAPCPNPTFSCIGKIDDEIQVVGRLGYAFGNFLPYVKGGYANVGLESNARPPFAGFNESQSHDGWVVGGGLEYAFTPSIIVGIDYSHIETDTVAYSTGVVGAARSIDANLDMVTGRLSYKFAPGYEPLK